MGTKLIAMILGIASVLAMTTMVTTQAFAASNTGGSTSSQNSQGQATKSALGDVCLSCWTGLAAHETQLGKELAGQATKSALGDVCLSCWTGLAAHETQQVGKVLSGELDNLGANLGTGGGSGTLAQAGQAGPQGLAGATGATGQAGQAGQAGPQGLAGATGATG